MILKWGAFAHDDNSVWFSLNRQAILSPSGKRFKVREVWSIRGTVKATSVSALTTKIAAIETAYASDGDKDLIFYLSDGTTETAHKRTAASTINGLRVIQPISWSAGNPGIWGAGIEYASIRSFSVVVMAEYLDLESDLLLWSETVNFSPDGTEFVIQESFTGAPTKYTTQLDIRFKGMQQGFAIGATSYPTESSSLFPTHTRARHSHVGYKLSTDFGINQNTKYMTFWKYHFEAATAITDSPTEPTF